MSIRFTCVVTYNNISVIQFTKYFIICIHLSVYDFMLDTVGDNTVMNFDYDLLLYALPEKTQYLY